MSTRAHNFSAGPAVLPLEVIELQQALPNYNGIGLGLMEMSHRSKDFDNIIHLLSVDCAHSWLSQKTMKYCYYKVVPVYSFTHDSSISWDLKIQVLTSIPVHGLPKPSKKPQRCATVETVWEPENGVFNDVPNDDDYNDI